MNKFLFVTIVFVNYVCGKELPKFLGSETNVTVVVGRDATLICVVENLHDYKVAWLRVDTQTILTIGPHVITKNHRIAVSKTDQTWSLTIRDVRLTDRGRYMCQINTEPMITQTHHLHVCVPPDIVDSGSSGEVIVREGDNVTLHCAASGTPPPSIAWRREDLAHMTVGGKTVSKWSGAWLNMTSVSRDMNGAYFCIATNGVPPSVSKRVLLHILCKPLVRVSLKLLGGYIGESIALQCKIEANPLTVVYWTHIGGDRLQNGSKYQESIKSKSYQHTATLFITNVSRDDIEAYYCHAENPLGCSKYQESIKSKSYQHTATLFITNVSRDDIGAYYCHAENPLGYSFDDLTLYTLATTTPSTTESTTAETELDTTLLPSTEYENVLEEKFSEDDNFVVVLSQHQMQNLDLSPSL